MQKPTYNVSVQATSLQQLNAVARCYQQCFPQSLAAKLGLAYIQATLQFFFIKEKRFLFHVEYNNQVIGFCGGYIPAKYGDGSTSGMLQLGMVEAIKSVIKKPWLLLNKEVIAIYPLVCKNIWQKIWGNYNKQVAQKVAPPSFILSAGLVVIGVHPTYQGSNIFLLLMQQFDAQVQAYQITTAALSVKQNNIRAIKAYQKCNWQIVETLGNTFVLKKNYLI